MRREEGKNAKEARRKNGKLGARANRSSHSSVPFLRAFFALFGSSRRIFAGVSTKMRHEEGKNAKEARRKKREVGRERESGHLNRSFSSSRLLRAL
jgi:hypothetical protein